jgi:HAD superfamily hydrolase (TIGR01490 family)
VTPRAAAFFDLDKTIIAKSSVLAFGKSLYREGLLSRRAIVRSAYAQVIFMLVGADENKMEKLRGAMLDMIRGWNQHEVAAIVREALDEVVTPIIFSEALDLIEEHQQADRLVVIVSSAPEEVVRPLGEFLGVDDVIATRAEVDAHGNYTGELAFYGYGPFKADAVRALASREGLELSESFAYSDSITDEPMLRAVGNPVAVNPDRELARLAREEGWPTLRFVRPVRLRDRFPVPPRPVLVVTGAMAAAGASVLVWWWLHRRERAPAPAPA